LVSPFWEKNLGLYQLYGKISSGVYAPVDEMYGEEMQAIVGAMIKIDATARPNLHQVLMNCEDPRPHAWSMCASCFCLCISLSRATPLGRSRYQTSEFPTEVPTHTHPRNREGAKRAASERWGDNLKV